MIKILLALFSIVITISFALPVQKGVAGPPVPPFLKDAPKEAIDSFHELIGNAHHLTDKQIDQAVEEWVEKQSEKIQAEWVEFQEERIRHQANSAKAHKAAYEKFSDAAKKADRKLAEIATHEELTATQKYEKIEDVLKSLPKEVRHEIEEGLFQTL